MTHDTSHTSHLPFPDVRAAVSGDGVVLSEARAIYKRAARLEQEATTQKQQVARVDAATADKLREIGKEEAVRGARARAAVIAESYPPPQPAGNILERAGRALRGQ